MKRSLPGKAEVPEWTLTSLTSESVHLVGGGRALLLQLANPRIAHAVARHSQFGSQPQRRLIETLRYLVHTLHGGPWLSDSAASRVRAIHGRVPDAEDAELQLWVAATLFDTMLDIHERTFGPLNARSAEAIYTDFAVVACALGMPASYWPPDLPAFREYWNRAVDQLDVGDDARAVAHDLLRGRHRPVWLKASGPVVRLTTSGLLPEALRAAYELPWSRAREKWFSLTLKFGLIAYRTVPATIRHAPRDALLARPRQRRSRASRVANRSA